MKYRCWIFLAMLLPSFGLCQSISIEANDLKQEIDMMGGDMERSSIAIQKAENKEEIINWGFGDIDFNTCRIQFDKNQELVEGTKNWDFYKNQLATMKSIKEVNPDIRFFATMRTDYDGYGDDNNMPDWIVDYSTKDIDTTKYAIFLADYIEYMEDQGVAITYLSTTKEWYWYVRPRSADDIIRILNRECDKRGIKMPLISDQGFWSLSQGIKYMSEVSDLGTQDLYHSFCTHNYQNEDEDKWIESIAAANALGKPMYDDEMSTGAGGPSYGEEPSVTKPVGVYAERAIAYKAGLSGEIFFEIWSRGIDKETRSIYYPKNGTGTRLRGYYIMKQFANNILNSNYVTSTPSDMSKVYTMAFRKDDKLVLWVINDGDNTYENLPIKISGEKIKGDVSVLSWDSDDDITGETMTIDPDTSEFKINLASNSMASYIFYFENDEIVSVLDNPLNEPTQENIFNYTLTKNILHIQLSTVKTAQFEIFNVVGEPVKSGTLYDSSMSVDVHDFSKGIYFLKVQNGDKSSIMKFIN